MGNAKKYEIGALMHMRQEGRRKGGGPNHMGKGHWGRYHVRRPLTCLGQ